MSLGDADAKFPNQSSGALPPSPSRENPAQVYPKSDPKAAPAKSVPGTGGSHQPSSVVGNPFSLQSAFSQLDLALNGVISALESEERAVGSSVSQDNLISKFKSWRSELTSLRGGVNRFGGKTIGEGEPQEGGMFTD